MSNPHPSPPPASYPREADYDPAFDFPERYDTAVLHDDVDHHDPAAVYHPRDEEGDVHVGGSCGSSVGDEAPMEMRTGHPIKDAVALAVDGADEKELEPLQDDQSHDDEADKEDIGDEEGNALPRRPQGCWARFSHRLALIVGTVIPAGGILASGMNIAGSTIGGGILGLPAGANQTGLILACIYVVLMVTCNIMSMRMLAITAEKTKIRSFEAMARYLFPQGHYAYSYWTAFIRWFNSMGSSIAYVISVGNCFKPIFTGAHEKYPNNPGYAYFMTPNGLKVMTVIVFFCIMLPLILPRHVDSLRHAAFAAIVLMLYFCVIVVVHSCIYGLKEHRHNVTLSGHMGRGDEEGKVFLFRTGNSVVEALGTFVFSFTCQTNAVEVYWDMAKHLRNPNGYTAAAALALITCGTIYTFVFIFGYFDFGAKTLSTNSILLLYKPMEEPEVMLAYVGVLVKLCVAYALTSLAARNCVFYAAGFTERYAHKKGKALVLPKHHKKKDQEAKEVANEPAVEKPHEPLAFVEGKADDSPKAPHRPQTKKLQELQRPGRDGEEVEEVGLDVDQSYIDNIPIQWHLLVVGLIGAVTLLLGLFIPAINVVFNFAGSICGSFLSFINPALFLMYSGDFTIKRLGLFTWVTAHVLLVIGVTALVFGTGATVYGLAGGK